MSHQDETPMGFPSNNSWFEMEINRFKIIGDIIIEKYNSTEKKGWNKWWNMPSGIINIWAASFSTTKQIKTRNREDEAENGKKKKRELIYKIITSSLPPLCLHYIFFKSLFCILKR